MGGLTVPQQQQHQIPSHMDLSTRSVPTGISGGDGGMLGAMQQATMQGNFQGGAMRNNSLPMRSNSLSGGGGQGSGGLDLAAMAQSYAASQEGQQGGAGVNEAMEKLCESMRRSAMSRTLVKQLSGRSLHRTPSGRSVQRNKSDQRSIVRANSGRSLSRAHSGKGLQRSNHGQVILAANGTDGVAELQPMRRMAPTPTRGVFRHHSSTAALGVNSLAAMQQLQQQQQMQHQGGNNNFNSNNQMDPSSFHGSGMDNSQGQHF